MKAVVLNTDWNPKPDFQLESKNIEEKPNYQRFVPGEIKPRPDHDQIPEITIANVGEIVSRQ